MASVRSPITAGFDRHFFERIIITSTDFGDMDGYANILIPIRSGFLDLSLINEGAVTVEYSFNGNTLHGDMVPSTASASRYFEGINRSKIWFRVSSGSAAVRVESWSRV